MHWYAGLCIYLSGSSHRRGLIHSAPESPLRRASVEYYDPYANERYVAKKSNESNVQSVRHGLLQPLLKGQAIGGIYYRLLLPESRER